MTSLVATPWTPPLRRWAVVVLVLAAGMLALPWTGHSDDSDAQLYRVVTRNMVADGTWTQLRYLPDVHPHFREHLPFGLWPYAVALKWVGEPALDVVSALFSLGTLLWMLFAAGRLGNPRAGVFAAGLLLFSEAFFVTGGLSRLDAPLVFFALGAAVMGLVLPLSWESFVGVTLLAALGVLVKGPFGLLPLVSAGVARAFLSRSPRVLLFTAGAALLSLLPLCAFFYWDLRVGGGSWWQGYGKAQLLASAVGSRDDGLNPFWYPLRTLAVRFWPGLPFAAFGAFLLLRKRGGLDALRLVGLTALLCLLGLCLPARKLWHHALVLFPPLLALMGGLALSEVLDEERWDRRLFIAMTALAVLAWVGVTVRAGRWIYKPRCVATLFAQPLSALLPGDEIAVVTDKPDWGALSSLAAERKLVPRTFRTLPAKGPAFSLVKGEGARAPSSEVELSRAGGWVLLHRR